MLHAELIRLELLRFAEDVGPSVEQVVDPVLLERHERVLALEVEQFVALELAVQEEDRCVHPLVADLEAPHADGVRIVLALFQELKADQVVEHPRRPVTQPSVCEVSECLLEVCIWHG